MAGSDIGQGNALNSISWYHAQLGQYEPAVTCCLAGNLQLPRPR
ncbi:MAG TPA: hypothetical protein VGD48_14640 [Kutzneria sp.]